MLVVMRLQHSGHDVAQAGDGATAVESCRQDAPDLVVLDVRLPGPSGLDLQAAFQSRGIELPIVFLTGHADVPSTVRAMRAGAVDFLEKPVARELLFEASVAGGIPIVRAVREGLAGDRLLRVAGILNGTCNYILTRMDSAGLSFTDALTEAQCGQANSKASTMVTLASLGPTAGAPSIGTA